MSEPLGEAVLTLVTNPEPLNRGLNRDRVRTEDFLALADVLASAREA